MNRLSYFEVIVAAYVLHETGCCRVNLRYLVPCVIGTFARTSVTFVHMDGRLLALCRLADRRNYFKNGERAANFLPSVAQFARISRGRNDRFRKRPSTCSCM